jgi:hypothetical protein
MEYKILNRRVTDAHGQANNNDTVFADAIKMQTTNDRILFFRNDCSH